MEKNRQNNKTGEYCIPLLLKKRNTKKNNLRGCVNFIGGQYSIYNEAKQCKK